MSQLEYEDILKEKLSKLRGVQLQLDELNKSKDEIRAQAKKWLELAQLREHSLEDSDGFPWRLSLTDSERRSVADWDKLSLLITDDEYASVVKLTDLTTFRVSRVKVK